MNNLNSEQLGYIAGLIDGEGSIQIQRRKHRSKTENCEYVYDGYSLYLDMSNTNKDLIDWCVENIGGYWGSKNNPKPERWKEAYYWRLSGKETKNFLKKIVHLLIDKRERALVALSFPLKSSKKDKILKENLFNQMKQLNCRGKISAATTKQWDTLRCEAIV
jgi:hypothetical protein